MTAPVEISVIVPVTERFDDVETVFHAYRAALEASGATFEFIYILDGDYPDVLAALLKLRGEGHKLKIVTLAKWFGEATALTVGFAHAAGDVIVTLPAYLQIEPGEIPRLLAALDGHDMVIARRFPRADSRLNILQSAAFHAVLRRLVDVDFRDLGCGVRAFKRAVVQEVELYGDQHRFLPLLAHRRGFKVLELEARQAEQDFSQRIYSPGVYVRRLLDILTIGFIVKFTRKPLRFFGLIGSSTLFMGALWTIYLVIERLFFDVALADRPALVLAVVMIVLGFQMIAVGLIGELIIFTHAKDIKEYTIEQIVE